MRWAIRENEAMTLRRFCKGLNENLRREVVFQGVSTFDQVCTLVQNYKLVTIIMTLIVSLLGPNLKEVILC
jgi:hypothetical protein